MSGRRRPAPVRPLRAAPDSSDYVEHQTADGRRIFVHRQVLIDLVRLERDQHPNETAGLLFGGQFSDGGMDCAVVTDLISPLAGEVEGTPATVTITARGAERMIARAWLRNPLLQVLGWGHTHPRFKAYFSATDREEQSAWKHPASVGIVISGLAAAEESYKVFVGPESTEAAAVKHRHHPEEAGAVEVGAAPIARAPRRRSGESSVLQPAAQRLVGLGVGLVILVFLVVSILSWTAASESRDAARRAVVEIRQLHGKAPDGGGKRLNGDGSGGQAARSFGVNGGRIWP